MSLHDDRMVGWVAAYALGTAWAGTSRWEALAEIRQASGNDPAIVAEAIVLVRSVQHSDKTVRRRAERLLSEALASAEPRRHAVS